MVLLVDWNEDFNIAKPLTLYFGDYTVLHYNFGPTVLEGDVTITDAVDGDVYFYGSAVDPDWDVLGSLTDDSSGGVTTNNARWSGASPGIKIIGSGSFVENTDGNHIQVTGTNVNITIGSSGSNVKIDVEDGAVLDKLKVEAGAKHVTVKNDGEILNIDVEDGADDVTVESDGPIDLVTVNGQNVKLTVEAGQTVNNLLITAESSAVEINIEEDAKVKKLTVENAANAITIDNDGEITTLENHSYSTTLTGITPRFSIGSYPEMPSANLAQGANAGRTKLENLAINTNYRRSVDTLDKEANQYDWVEALDRTKKESTGASETAIDNIAVNKPDFIYLSVLKNGVPSQTQKLDVEYTDIKPAASPNAALDKGTNVGTTKLVNVAASMEYQVNNGAWQDITATTKDNIAVNLGDTIKVRIRETTNQPASYIQSIPVTQDVIGIVSYTSAHEESASDPDEIGGTFRISDYGSGSTTGLFYYRGFIFEVSETTKVTHLIGGGTDGTFTVVLYEAEKLDTTDSAGNRHIKATQLLGHVDIIGDAAEKQQTIIVANGGSTVTLEAGQLYILAQGRNSGSGNHYYVTDMDIDDLETHPRIKANTWEPKTNNSIRWSDSGDQHTLGNMDHHTDYTGVMPRIGFLFETAVELAEVVTEDVTNTATELTFKGTLNSTGAPQNETTDVSLFIEWGTDKQAVLDQTATLSAAEPATTTADNTDFEFSINIGEPYKTYYYRAVVINEAGRVNGALYKASPQN